MPNLELAERSVGDEYPGDYETDQLLEGHERVDSRRDANEKRYEERMFLLLGVGCLMPWNSLAGALDFFGALFPRYDPADAFAVANFGANMLFLVIQLHCCKCFAGRAVAGLLVYVLVLIYPLWLTGVFLAPLANGEEAMQESLFAVLVAGAALAGAANAGLQVVVMALAAHMGSGCIAAFMNGQAVAGIVTSVCRVVSKLLFQDREPFEALRLSSMLYFFSSAAAVVLCLWSWFSLQRLPATKEARAAITASARETSSHSGASLHALDTSLPDLRTPTTPLPEHAPPLPAYAPHARARAQTHSLLDLDRDMDVGNPPDWDDASNDTLATIKAILPAAVGVMSVFWVTLAVFPGVVTRIPAGGSDVAHWMPVILIATFNVGDLLGRYTAGKLLALKAHYLRLSRP
jgi:equilibrative nucleoside transporter 1/2/3